MKEGKINYIVAYKLDRITRTNRYLEELISVLKKDLEYKLIRDIEDFLLEIDKGFMFVGYQQRITLNNTDYYVDMVFN